MEELVSPVVLSHSILGLLRVQNEADGCKADDVYIRPGLRARSASQQGIESVQRNSDVPAKKLDFPEPLAPTAQPGRTSITTRVRHSRRQALTLQRHYAPRGSV